ncbi:MAG: FCD domain-containing protein [Peptoclostridium sp.]|uniref:GntR family transcriptional regulator n=1 Tax=Peptoclostridium sp. TaxID=1904860 RepID=UPI00139B41FA|nr:GntR family transcriptional regulator [Peptoclostridium sp.]MZQ75619.1 FCD domain-containing protein [Peptoclostridium sp.]
MVSNIFSKEKNKSSLSSKIFNVLRDNILEGKYVHDEKLIEVKLAQELGVSRTPVREALKQLELEGLVENIPNKGVVVKGISKQDISDIYTIRLAIEGIAVEWAMERMSEEDVEKLKEIYELMEFYTLKKDYLKISELNTQFHEVIYKATKSRYLEQVLKDFQYYIKTTRNKSLRTPGRLESALEEHREILDAFITKDPKKAREVLENHIDISKLNALKLED